MKYLIYGKNFNNKSEISNSLNDIGLIYCQTSKHFKALEIL